MGKVIEWSRRNRPGEPDESDWGRTFRVRRVHRATAWDWIQWWREHIGDSEFYAATRQQLAADSGLREQVAEQFGAIFPRRDLPLPLSAGLPDKSGVPE